MKRLNILLLVIICLFLLSGCWDKRELEDNTFAVLLGIDTAESDDVMVTIAFPLTQTEGGGADEGMDNGSGHYSVMSAKAPTVVEGLNLFSTKLSGPLALYAVKTIVISEELARSDMLRQVFSSWRYEELRNTTNVLISECKAAELIQARIKNAPIDPLRQEELLLEQANDSAYYTPIQLFELLASLKSDSGDGIAMYGGIAPQNEDGDKKDAKEEKDGTDIKEAVKDGYLPGEIPISSKNEIQLSGLSIFHNGKMAGTLNSLEAQTYSMLTQSNVKEILTIPDPLEPGYDIVVRILPSGNNEMNSAIRDGTPIFNIAVSLSCTVENIQSGIDYSTPQNYHILTEHIEDVCIGNMKNLIEKIQKGYNADILKLGDKLAYHFSTVSEWESYNWPEKYKDAKIDLSIKLDIERTGIMMPYHG